MILLLSNKDDLTTDLVVRRLEMLQAHFYRFNMEDLPSLSLEFLSTEQNTVLRDGELAIEMEKVRSVWYRRPGHPNIVNDVPSTLRDFAQEEYREVSRGLSRFMATKCFWMNDPRDNLIAENKLAQLSFIRKHTFPFPRTIVTNMPALAWEFYQREPQVVCKSMRQGIFSLAKQQHGIYTWLLPKGLTERDFAGVAHCPTQLQQWIPKKADIRTTVVGERMFSVRIDSQMLPETSVDWRTPAIQNLPHHEVETPANVASFVKDLMSFFHLHFAALDFVESMDGNWWFLEVNPNGQWAWLEQLAGVGISKAIADALVSGGDSDVR
jgi:glutathione synthase/RimK-type ligase-like ATP-grasp enzyme